MLGRLCLLCVVLHWGNICQALLLSEAQFSGHARVGFFIGTFDPPHIGHHETAMKAIETGELDYLVIIPNDFVPNKPDAPPVEHRLAMLRLMYKDSPMIVVPDEDITEFPLSREVVRIVKEKNPNGVYMAVAGTDVAARSSARVTIRHLLRDQIDEWLISLRITKKSVPVPNRIAKKPVQFFTYEHNDMSSTAVRGMVKAGRVSELYNGLLSVEVVRYILLHNLYMNGSPKIYKCTFLFGGQ